MAKNTEKIYHCPICKGSGAFELPAGIKTTDIEIKTYLAKHLRGKGYSIRQIMRALGYHSTRSISLMLNKK